MILSLTSFTFLTPADPPLFPFSILHSLAFIIYLYAVFLINLFFISGLNATSTSRSGIALSAIRNGTTKPAAQGYRTVPSTATTPRSGRPEYPGVLHGPDDEAYEMDAEASHFVIDEHPNRS